jgi:ribosomal protein S27E
MIRFRCPTCHADLQTGDGQAGKKVRCGVCGDAVVAPAAGVPRVNEYGEIVRTGEAGQLEPPPPPPDNPFDFTPDREEPRPPPGHEVQLTLGDEADEELELAPPPTPPSSEPKTAYRLDRVGLALGVLSLLCLPLSGLGAVAVLFAAAELLDAREKGREWPATPEAILAVLTGGTAFVAGFVLLLGLCFQILRSYL